MKLFCLPYAGGSTNVYIGLRNRLLPEAKMVAVELAGRGTRFHAPFYSDFANALEDVFQIVSDGISKGEPYILWGHSMGALFAVELADILRRRGEDGPETIIISGRLPLHYIGQEKAVSNLPVEELKSEMEKYGGHSRAIFENKELGNIFIPILRADYKLLDEYKQTRTIVLDKDLHIFWGDGDQTTPEILLKEWRHYTSASCFFYPSKGGHFFPFEKENDTILQINKIIQLYSR